MPWGNGTGPMGLGPMTGRAAGYCAGYGVPGYMNPYGGRPFYGGSYPFRGFGRGRGIGFGRGRGRSFGRGRGWRGWARWGYSGAPYYYRHVPLYW